MMLRERWRFVATLGIAVAASLALGVGPWSLAAAPLSSAAPTTVQQKAVKPRQGPPPDQAQQPDLDSTLPAGQQEQFPEPHPAPVTEAPPVAPAPDASSAPTPAIAAPAAPARPNPALRAAPEPVQPVPARPVVPAKTPEGRHLQQQTATLLELAQNLKDELAKAGNNTLSLAALRKAEQIQKLSKELKQEMSNQQQGSATK